MAQSMHLSERYRLYKSTRTPTAARRRCADIADLATDAVCRSDPFPDGSRLISRAGERVGDLEITQKEAFRVTGVKTWIGGVSDNEANR
jgi:hypothetical protein